MDIMEPGDIISRLNAAIGLRPGKEGNIAGWWTLDKEVFVCRDLCAIELFYRQEGKTVSKIKRLLKNMNLRITADGGGYMEVKCR